MYKKPILLTSLVFALALVLPSVTQAFHPTPVGWWKFDGDALDSSGHGLDGTLMGNPAPVFVPGVYGQALDTTESGGPGYVEITGYTGILGGNPFSITAWINPASGTQGTLMGWGSTAGGTTRFEFRAPSDENELRAESSGNVQGLTKLPSNEWIHVAVTVTENANITEPDVTLYLNGQVDNDTTTGSQNPLEMEAGYDVTIARRHSGSSRWLDAWIDDVRLYNVELTQEQVQEAMAGVPPTRPGATRDPDPEDKSTDVRSDVVLRWLPGDYAPATNGHIVYFSENFNDVNNGIGGLTQSATSYTPPQPLSFSTTYYWRVDEVNAPPDSTVHPGDVWSFTTEPYSYPIDGANIIATASSTGQANTGPENTINGSGLDADDLHSTEATDMWLSGNEPQAAWIQYEFDNVYKLHEMWVWNSNQVLEALFGFGFKDVTIETSTDGTDWTVLAGVPEFAKAPGRAGYAHNTTVDLGVAAKYVKLTASSNWGGALPQFGLSEVRFFYIPAAARGPSPASGATGVSIGTLAEPLDVTLSFRGGREAARHELYMGDSLRAVTTATAPTATLTETSYGPLSLDLGQTYFWRIDEVNDTESPAMWQGDIWSFSTQGYFVVDDFESYTDYPPDEIFSTWTDGYSDPTNGALIANDEAPFAETSIVHWDDQAMPYRYDNSAGLSEATLPLTSGRNWTQRGVRALSLWFRGYPVSLSRFAEAPAGVYTVAARSPSNITGSSSDEFHFAYKQLSGAGSIIAKVEWVRDADDGAQAGVMIRDTLDPDAVHGTVLLETNDIAADWELRFRRRTAAGAASSDTTIAGIMAPQWLKIERDMGGSVIASYSADGLTWTEMGREAITMNTPMYVGLVVASNDANVTCEAQFSNVQIVGASGAWSNQDVGIPNNDPAPMYVALANPGGAPAVVYYEDPEDPNVVPTQIGGYTEWNIDLQEFANRGVNLANVGSLSIGFGDKGNPTPGGKGKMYFDDIRLYPARCMPLLMQPSADLNNDCIVDHLELDMLMQNWLTGDTTVATTAPEPAGLMLHYKLDGDATDSSGNNYHGIENGGAAYVDGKFGQAIRLDGIDDFVAIQDMNYLGVGYPAVTVAAWIRTTDSGDGIIASFDRSEYWRIETNGAGAGPGQVGWDLWSDTAGTYVDTGSTRRVDDGQWHHVAGVFDNGIVTIYIDGTAEEPVISADSTFGRDRSGAPYLRYGFVGANSEASYPPPMGRPDGGWFEGDVDDFRVYHRALSAAEIAYLADESPEDGELYIAVPSTANVYEDEPPLARSVNFKDFAVIADQWLLEMLWP